ncbi:hypothetical protein [Thermoflexus sp.]|uniref:hypothetical protein n=1 Tax=Thermoflexus sp. TaxID=1969742 RepID=UPI0035E42843
MEPVHEIWLERILEDESWRGGLTDAQAQRLLQWALARIGPHPEETGEALHRAMRRIRRAVQSPPDEADGLLAEWGIRTPPEWTSWTMEERLAWTLEALSSWRPGYSGAD